MLAINRTAYVPGRIKFLIVSMQTIKGINTDGVPTVPWMTCQLSPTYLLDEITGHFQAYAFRDLSNQPYPQHNLR